MRSLCISHVKDVDGISSAALARAATGCECRLADYDSIFTELDRVPKEVQELIICDLGTDQSRFGEFLARLKRLSEGAKVTYIDHHYIPPESKRALGRLPIRLVHSVNDCAGMLTYLTFRSSLPEEARMISLYAAVTDYLDGSSNARRIMETFERHLILLESTLLSYALARRGREKEYPLMLVEQLSRMRLPHQIEGVPEDALAYAKVVTSLMKKVSKEGTMLRSLAYFETKETSTGTVAKLILGAFDVKVGVSFRRKENSKTEMSLRCTSGCKVHLGRTIGAIAQKHGGSGGGHARAAGCTVPTREVMGVIRDLDQAVTAPT